MVTDESTPTEIAFEGPFSWHGTSEAPCLFLAEVARSPGIYLWTVQISEGFLIYYVGETGRSHATRMAEHYREHAAGMYHVYEPSGFARGEKKLLWSGLYERTDRKSIADCIGTYLELAPHIHSMSMLFRFFLAPCTVSQRIRKRIEAAIADALYATPGFVGEFQDRGIRYDRRLGTEKDRIPCRISASAKLLGMPEKVDA